jgi:hypothetical protein
MGVEAVAAAVAETSASAAQLVGRGAGQLDRPGERARALDSAAAAACHPRLAEPLGIVGRPAHPAAERVGLRDSVEDEQQAARRIAAERAQGRPLAGRVGRARVGAAEELEAGDVAEQILEPPRGGGREALAVEDLG